MGTDTGLSMIYKIQDNCIEGYEGNVLVSMLYITDPVARAKYILQLHNSGELDART
jgi:hypothetical protein